MPKEPPKDLIDALKQIFYDSNLLAVYGVTFLVALIIPFMVSLIVRKLNQIKLNQCQTGKMIEQQPEDGSVELPNGMGGYFNKSVLDFLRPSNRNLDEDKNTKREFENEGSVLDACLDKQGIAEEDVDDDELQNKMENEDIVESDNTNFEQPKELADDSEKPKKKPRKKFKDPDPETAEALNKIIEKGLHGKLATAQLRAKTNLLEEKMSEEERKKEQQIQQEQLAKIFEMMETQKEKFGIDKEEMAEQMKLYGI